MNADPQETVREALDEAFVTSSGRSGRLYAEGETVAAEQWKQRALRLQKALAALPAITAERDRYKEALERVRALVEKWAIEPNMDPEGEAVRYCGRKVLAALAAQP